MSMEEIDLWWRFSWWNPILKNFEYVKTIKAYIGGNSFIGGLIWGYATSGISTAVFTIINIIDDIQKEGSGEYLGLPKDIVLNEVLPESMYRVGVVAYHLGKVFIVGKGKEWFVGKYGDRISNGVDKI